MKSNLISREKNDAGCDRAWLPKSVRDIRAFHEYNEKRDHDSLDGEAYGGDFIL